MDVSEIGLDIFVEHRHIVTESFPLSDGLEDVFTTGISVEPTNIELAQSVRGLNRCGLICNCDFHYCSQQNKMCSKPEVIGPFVFSLSNAIALTTDMLGGFSECTKRSE